MPSVFTARRIRHANGYIGLGMTSEASDELESIEGEDRLSLEVMIVRSELYMQAKNWDLLVAVAREVVRCNPDSEKGWIDWAYALRELNRVKEAKAVLLEAEPRHGKSCGGLHYSLACYHCLLGELPEARERLRTACKMDKQWKAAALDDPDIEAIWGEVGVM